MNDRQSTSTDLLLGAIAGGVATVALGGVTSALYGREDPAARRMEDRARGGLSAYEIAANRLAGAAQIRLSDERRSAAGAAIHYGLRIGSGSLYGARPAVDPALGPAPRAGVRRPALWLIADEGATPALGLTPGPRAFPWQTHARALAAHLVYGLVAESFLGIGDSIRSSGKAELSEDRAVATNRLISSGNES